MSSGYSEKMKIAILAIICCFVWGSAFAFAKLGFETMPPMRLSGYRFMLAGLMLVPILIARRYDWRSLKGDMGFILLFAFVQTVCQYGLFYVGLDMAPAAVSAIIIGGAPFFIAILAHFSLSNDKLSLRKIISIIFGVAGVVFISLKNSVSFDEYPNFYIGILLLLVSNIIGSYANIMVVKRKRKVDNIALIALSCFFGGVVLYLLSLIFEPDGAKGILGYSLKFYLSILWLSMIPAIGFSVWYYLLQLPTVKVSELNVWKFLVPVFGVILSWCFLSNESPDIYSIIGIAIISVSIITLQIKSR